MPVTPRVSRSSAIESQPEATDRLLVRPVRLIDPGKPVKTMSKTETILRWKRIDCPRKEVLDD
jgi:hypothetical protein